MSTPAHTPTVRLHLFGVTPARVPSAIARMGTTRWSLRGLNHLMFSKLLGTAAPTTFTTTSADPLHWGMLTVWSDAAAAEAFDASRAVRSWELIAHEALRMTMVPIASQGHWSGRQPFGEPDGSAGRDHSGPVAAITRARLKASKAAEFGRASEQVAQALREVNGLLLSTGIGEAPLLLQGTFSIWESAQAMREFAYSNPAHTEVIARTPDIGWYAEELFARFAVTDLHGTFAGLSFDHPHERP